ncbi:MAG: class I SAM-dependent methyltransferase [Patescibacteria group bacterium]|nr:class I SAM-dependent methyltransferase [Patescibacteria group bacterium]
MDWASYQTQTKGNAPRPLLIKGLQFVEHPGKALDMGAGALNETRFLLQRGFQVTALDREKNIAQIACELDSSKLTVVVSIFEEFDFPIEEYDLICALYSLPFIGPDSIPKVVGGICNALRPHGVFCGVFFGPRDSWNTPDSHMSFHTEKEIRTLLSPLQIISIDEREYDGETVSRNKKHWHIFDVIVKKSKER